MKPLTRLLGSPGPAGLAALSVAACAAMTTGGGAGALPTAGLRASAAVRPEPLAGSSPCTTTDDPATEGPTTRSAAHPIPQPTERMRWFRRQAVPGPDMLLTADRDDQCVVQAPSVLPLPSSSSVLPVPSSSAPGTGPHAPSPGAETAGDPYFPQTGNGGYDATNYDVTLGYQPTDKSIDATVVISATAQRDLSSFDLDYRGPKVRAVSVNGAPAASRRTASKLVITPRHPLAGGSQFTASVHYAGVPAAVGNPDLGTYGWVPSKDGAVVLSEPDGASTWLPVNDHPSDKATYTFRITVPSGLQVMANGTPDQPVTTGGHTTYVWHEKAPMASYLASIAIGHFLVRRGMAGSIPVITAVDPQYARTAKRLYTTTVAALNWEISKFGPYPFDTAGGVVDDPRLGYALETQERPVYAGFAPDDDFVVHELAHQWFGDSVSLTTWKDIWLNEGFATYAEWLWHERNGRDSAKRTFARYYKQPSTSPIFNPPPGRPGHDQLFSFSVYIRGAMTLQALRDRVGTPTFFRILKAWAAQHRYGNATTAQFETLAEQVSHRRLGHLFDVWLNTRGKPKSW